MAYLVIKNLSKNFAGVKAVNNISFDIQEGTVNAMVGPNGSGKTTIFDIITGFVKPDSGQVIFKGESVLNKKPWQIAQMGLSRTFQLIRLFPKLTCLDNLLLARDNKKYAREFLKLVGLESKKNSLAEN